MLLLLLLLLLLRAALPRQPLFPRGGFLRQGGPPSCSLPDTLPAWALCPCTASRIANTRSRSANARSRSFRRSSSSASLDDPHSDEAVRLTRSRSMNSGEEQEKAEVLGRLSGAGGGRRSGCDTGGFGGMTMVIIVTVVPAGSLLSSSALSISGVKSCERFSRTIFQIFHFAVRSFPDPSLHFPDPKKI